MRRDTCQVISLTLHVQDTPRSGEAGLVPVSRSQALSVALGCSLFTALVGQLSLLLNVTAGAYAFFSCPWPASLAASVGYVSRPPPPPSTCPSPVTAGGSLSCLSLQPPGKHEQRSSGRTLQGHGLAYGHRRLWPPPPVVTTTRGHQDELPARPSTCSSL